MLTLLAVVHIFIGLALMLFVLLQDPKGGAMGVFSGGSSSSSFFGNSGASNFLTTATKWLAVAFAVTCLALTYYTTRRGASVMDAVTPGAGQPVTPTQPLAPSAPGAGAPVAPATPANTPPKEGPASSKASDVTPADKK